MARQGRNRRTDKSAGGKRRGPRFSTWLTAVLLIVAVAASSYLYYDLFRKPVSAAGMAAADEVTTQESSDGEEGAALSGTQAAGEDDTDMESIGQSGSTDEESGTDGTPADGSGSPEGPDTEGSGSSSGDAGEDVQDSASGEGAAPEEPSEEDIEKLRTMTTGLYGKTDVIIVDGDTAIDALTEVQDELGILNAQKEYRSLSSSSDGDNNIFRLQQYYDGIPVYGYTLKVVADRDGNLLYVNGTYAEISDLDTSYSISSGDVKKYVVNYMTGRYSCTEDEVSVGDIEKVIYVPDDENARPAYSVQASCAGTEALSVFVDGQTGAILWKSSRTVDDMTTTQLAGQTANLLTGIDEERSLAVYENDDGTYTLADTERGIYIYDYVEETGLTVSDTSEKGLLRNALIYLDTSTMGDIKSSLSGVDALYNLQIVYDFYSDIYGREGISGQGADYPLVVFVDYILKEVDEDGNVEYKYDNASYTFKEDGDSVSRISVRRESYLPVAVSYYLDALAHEFGHGIVDWESSLGTLLDDDDFSCSMEISIHEGLADVLSVFAADYADDGALNDSGDWYVEPVREVSGAADGSSGLVTLVDDFKTGSTEAHKGSAMVSYPAYLMNQGLSDHDLLSVSQMAKLYYRTICNMEANTDFYIFRYLLEWFAADMNLSGELSDGELETVIDAMDFSGVEPSLADYKVEKGGTITILDVDGEEYDNYTIAIEKGIGSNTKTIVAAQDATGASYTLPESLSPGYYKVVLTDRSNTGRTEEVYLLVNDNDELSVGAGRIDAYESQQDIQTNFGMEEKEVVLVLDVSGSMQGTPVSDTKEAVTEFVGTVVDEDLEDVRVSLVTYSNDAEVKIRESSDIDRLETAAAGISANGSTNMYAGLTAAQSILEESQAEKKIIILMSDGLPNAGEQSGGDYETPILQLAQELKSDEVTIYALGFFSELSGTELSEAVSLMRNIATSGYYYNISSDGIAGVFDDMASLVGGQLYDSIVLACPVEVVVTSGGETLSSSERYGSTRTSFGSVTFEGEDEEDLTKIVRLVTDRDYEICVYGTGKGTMDYTISFPDEEGNYTDVRTFTDIPVTSETQIVSTTVQEEDTALEIDSDGDGAIDEILYAGRNEEGQSRMDQFRSLRRILIPVLIAAAVLLVILELLLIRKRLRRNRRCAACGAAVRENMEFCPSCGAPLQRVRIFLPGKAVPDRPPRRPQSRPAKICKGIVITLCLVVIAGSMLTWQSKANRVYNEIRRHRLTTAQRVYQNGVDDSALSRFYLSIVLDNYMIQVQEARADGTVSAAYAAEVYETVAALDLGEVSELAEDSLR